MPTAIPLSSPWRDRVWKEFRAGNLTRAYRDVLLTLATFRSAGGLIIPSHATLADRAKCSVRTVQRALGQGGQLGLVTWAERRLRAAWRWLRTSNSYHLTAPDGPVQPGLRPIWPRRATTGQLCRGGESLRRKEAWAEMRRAAAALPDLLAMRRAVIERRLMGAG